MEDGSSTAVALEDGRSMAALQGGFGQQLKIAVVVLGSGFGRRTCDEGIGIRVVYAKGYCHNIGISVDNDNKRGCVQCKGCTLTAMVRK